MHLLEGYPFPTHPPSFFHFSRSRGSSSSPRVSRSSRQRSVLSGSFGHNSCIPFIFHGGSHSPSLLELLEWCLKKKQRAFLPLAAHSQGSVSLVLKFYKFIRGLVRFLFLFRRSSFLRSLWEVDALSFRWSSLPTLLDPSQFSGIDRSGRSGRGSGTLILTSETMFPVVIPSSGRTSQNSPSLKDLVFLVFLSLFLAAFRKKGKLAGFSARIIEFSTETLRESTTNKVRLLLLVGQQPSLFSPPLPL